MGKVKGSFLVETMVATVVISIVMLLFAGFLFNVAKAQVDYKYKIEASIESNKMFDSLRYFNEYLMEERTFDKGELTFQMRSEKVNANLWILNVSAYFNNKLVIENEILKYEDL